MLEQRGGGCFCVCLCVCLRVFFTKTPVLTPSFSWRGRLYICIRTCSTSVLHDYSTLQMLWGFGVRVLIFFSFPGQIRDYQLVKNIYACV